MLSSLHSQQATKTSSMSIKWCHASWKAFHKDRDQAVTIADPLICFLCLHLLVAAPIFRCQAIYTGRTLYATGHWVELHQSGGSTAAPDADVTAVTAAYGTFIKGSGGGAVSMANCYKLQKVCVTVTMDSPALQSFCHNYSVCEMKGSCCSLF